jgi:hypothetical protein
MADPLARPRASADVHSCERNQFNRLENLELWTRPQPTGIRASDAVAWAREILARYEGELSLLKARVPMSTDREKQNAPSG